ncbi:MAG TPA: 3-dehydroquinate synthase [Pyrinomonadaceae bacterium]|jgi:3-dehydroquinate synthase
MASKIPGYKITIERGKLEKCGFWAKHCLMDFGEINGSAKKIVIISNAKVFDLYGQELKRTLEDAKFEVFVWLMKDGEKYKNLRSLERALKFFSEKRLTRSDAVVALGGGVVGDLAGFASAIYLRGIDFLQIPTTLLAMIDSSVGGKTAVNSDFGKNLIGAFHNPRGVLIDVETLKTLPERELTAGFCEVVKQGAISGKALFNQTAKFLKDYSPNDFEKHFSDRKFWSDMEKLIDAQVQFKTKIVRGDEREYIARTDAKSRKILNFGHTVAHALEKITNYEYFKHGEAVGYGMLAAGAIANNIGIFDKNELKSLNDVIDLAGTLPNTKNIEVKDVIEAFEFDKKSIDKSLQWILLRKIGKPVIIGSEKIPTKILLKSLNTVLKRK